MLKRSRNLLVATAAALLLCLPAAADEDVDVSVDKGGVTVKKGNNSLHIGARSQFRYTGTDMEDFDADGNPKSDEFGEDDGYAQEFEVKRMRLVLDGGMWKPWLKYKFQFEFAGSTKIKDAIIDIRKLESLNLRMGQFKSPFSLQELTSSGSQQFVDRAITNKKFAPGRDQGLMLFGGAAQNKFGYSAGVFNGGGESNPQDDQGFMYVARVWYDLFNPYKPSESAVENPDGAQFHFGIGARTGETARGSNQPNLFEDPTNETAYNFEIAYKWKRIFATAEYFMMSNERVKVDPNTNAFVENAPDLRSLGWHVQAGVMLIPKKLEVAARYAQIDPDNRDNGSVSDDDGISEARLGFGYFWNSHKLKVQADVGQITFEEDYANLSTLAMRNLPSRGSRLTDPPASASFEEVSDLELRVQMQVAF